MARITAKREARETGLVGVAQGPRGYDLRVDGENVGQVYPYRNDMWARNYDGWKIQLFESDKVEKRVIYNPKGNKNGWPFTDEGLEQAKNVALDLVKKIYG